MSKADETIKRAVKESLDVLSDRGSETAVDKIAAKLDTPKIRQAIEESDSARDDARRSALSQKEHPDDYPKVKPDQAD